MFAHQAMHTCVWQLSCHRPCWTDLHASLDGEGAKQVSMMHLGNIGRVFTQIIVSSCKASSRLQQGNIFESQVTKASVSCSSGSRDTELVVAGLHSIFNIFK